MMRNDEKQQICSLAKKLWSDAYDRDDRSAEPAFFDMLNSFLSAITTEAIAPYLRRNIKIRKKVNIISPAGLL